jgi:transposase-like protein
MTNAHGGGKTREAVAQGLAQGKGVGEIAEELGVHRNSVSVHKRSIVEGGGLVDSDSVVEYRAQQLIELADLRAEATSEKIPAARRVELKLKILELEMRLTGTAAPSKSLNMNADADLQELVIRVEPMGHWEDGKWVLDKPTGSGYVDGNPIAGGPKEEG